jgi:hypothetical protein
MKTLKSVLLIIACFIAGSAAAQKTADEIINKYLDAIGGKDKLKSITSVYTESTIDVMGMQGNMKLTTLNGKGMKQDLSIMDNSIITCYTDKDGWSINPMTGNTSAETMSDIQYEAGKDQIFIGGPFINLSETGSKAELLGQETIDNISAYKIGITTPKGSQTIYYFDPNTGFLIRSIQQVEMQGQMTDNMMTFSDYKATDGFMEPYKVQMDIAGGQFSMLMTVTKVELNKPVDEAIFAKPI